MKVQDVMSMSVATCSMTDSLQSVAQKLWDHDCGCLPVVDVGGRPVAMITDRDVCMAAFTTGRTLADLRVADSMSKSLVTCRPQEELGAVAQRMSKHAVRRVPVVDAGGKLIGLLSLNDLACATSGTAGKTVVADAASTAMRVLESCSRHRSAVPQTVPGAASREAPA